MSQKVVMRGCQKHFRIKSGIYFVPVSPQFFDAHAHDVLSTIQQTICDACIRELENAQIKESQNVAETATEPK